MKRFLFLLLGITALSPSAEASTIQTRWQPPEPRNISGSMALSAKFYLKLHLPTDKIMGGLILAKNETLNTIKKLEDGVLNSGTKGGPNQLVMDERNNFIESVADFILLVFEKKKYLEPMVAASLRKREGILLNDSMMFLKDSILMGFIKKETPADGVKFLLERITTEETLKQTCKEIFTLINDIVESVPNARPAMEALEENPSRIAPEQDGASQTEA